MYIYHFWPLCMHCQKTTTIRCFLEATYDLLVVLRKPWICTLCFDAHFSKFRDFWWFLVIFNRKMDILDLFWGPLTASSPKVTIYLPLTHGPSQNLLKTLSKPLFLTTFGPLLRVLWTVTDIRPSKMALFDLVRNGVKWCKYVQKLFLAPLKLPCANWGTKTTILHFWHPVFGPLFLTSRTKMLICSALIDGPQNRAQKP